MKKKQFSERDFDNIQEKGKVLFQKLWKNEEDRKKIKKKLKIKKDTKKSFE